MLDMLTLCSAIMIETVVPEPRLKESERDVQWYETEGLSLDGQGWSSLPHRYARLPNHALGQVTEAVWQLGQDSAGVSLDFTTDAQTIYGKWSVHNRCASHANMTQIVVEGVDLYVLDGDRWRWLSVGRDGQAKGLTPLVDGMPPGRRRYRLYLPLYAGVASLRIGLPHDARFWVNEPDGQPGVCFYGTSIVQGASASRPGMAYPSILGRRLGRSVVNLGFSGSGKMEPEMADLLGELDPAAYVIDCLPNLMAPLLSERLGPFLDRLRSARPITPIVAVGSIPYPAAFLLSNTAKRIADSTAVFNAVIKERIEGGDENLHVVPGESLLGDDGEATIDGTHPNDLGMVRLADTIEPAVRSCL